MDNEKFEMCCEGNFGISSITDFHNLSIKPFEYYDVMHKVYRVFDNKTYLKWFSFISCKMEIY